MKQLTSLIIILLLALGNTAFAAENLSLKIDCEFNLSSSGASVIQTPEPFELAAPSSSMRNIYLSRDNAYYITSLSPAGKMEMSDGSRFGQAFLLSLSRIDDDFAYSSETPVVTGRTSSMVRITQWEDGELKFTYRDPKSREYTESSDSAVLSLDYIIEVEDLDADPEAGDTEDGPAKMYQKAKLACNVNPL